MDNPVKIEVWFDEHHVGSAGSLARIIADNYPAMKILATNGKQIVEYAQQTPGLHVILHSCTFCDEAIRKALG